jgi:hypothetical protein
MLLMFCVSLTCCNTFLTREYLQTNVLGLPKLIQEWKEPKTTFRELFGDEVRTRQTSVLTPWEVDDDEIV